MEEATGNVNTMIKKLEFEDFLNKFKLKISDEELVKTNMYIVFSRVSCAKFRSAILLINEFFNSKNSPDEKECIIYFMALLDKKTLSSFKDVISQYSNEKKDFAKQM